MEFAAANEDDDAMRELPKQELPIVVASRMSVSFPVLFTAVPLWALDHEARPPVFRRCLFSDGSLCSNFPIHFFDSPIPAWPTFGISLYELPDHGEKRGATPRRGATDSATEKCNQDAVSVPQDHREGAQERWRIFAEQPGTFARLSGFVGALFSTTKDWNDATLARLPGVRDRVARVGLEPGIGGLNILMTKEQIECLACLGAEAARKLLDRFAKPSNLRGVADGWSEHRWVRFNVLRDCLFRSLAGLTWSAAQAPYAVPLREQVRHAVDQPPLAQDAKSQLLPAQAAALDRVLTALIQAEHSLTAPTVGQPYEPDPRPELRIRPPL